MKKIILLILVGILLVAGCEQQKVVEVICNKPYLLVGTSCCLDIDDNNVCDKDEIKKEEPKAEVKEEIEAQPKEEKPIEKTKQTYTMNDLKDNLNEVFWVKNKIWSLMNESNQTVSFYKYGFDDLIIAESHDLDKYSYEDFLDATFFFLTKDKSIEPKNFVSSDSYFKEIKLSSLDVKDKREYWIYENNILTSHSLNYVCSPNLFVRVIPPWTFESVETAGDEVVGVEIGFDSSTRRIISEVYKTTINCPFAKKYDNKIYELQDEINNELKVDYPFEVRNMQDGTTSHTSIDDDNSVKIYDEITRKYYQQTYKYKKIVIDELLKKINRVEDLKDISNIHANEDEKTLKTNVEDKKRGLAIIKDITMGKVENISKNSTVNFNEINVINQETIEILKGTFDEYEVTYSKSYYSERKRKEVNYKEKYVDLNLIHKMLFKCKEDLVVSVYSNSIEYGYDKYGEENVDTAIKASRNNLLKDIANIKKACEAIY